MAEPQALKLLADAGPNLNKDTINLLTHCQCRSMLINNNKIHVKPSVLQYLL